MKLNTTMNTSYTQKDISLLCPRCYETMYFGDIHIDLNMSLSPMMDQRLISICPSFVTGYSQENLHLLTRHVVDVNCPNCNIPMIQIDHSLVNVLSLLNKRGYYTVASCSGHKIDEDNNIYSSPYILLREKLPQQLIDTLKHQDRGRSLMDEGCFEIKADGKMIIPSSYPNEPPEEQKRKMLSLGYCIYHNFPNIPVSKRKHKTMFTDIKANYRFKYDNKNI